MHEGQHGILDEEEHHHHHDHDDSWSVKLTGHHIVALMTVVAFVFFVLYFFMNPIF